MSSRSPDDHPATVAITGVRTFLGQRLAERLPAARGRLKVIGLDIRRPYRLQGGGRFREIDLTDPTADGRLAEILEAEHVEALVHTAFRERATPDLEYDHELETLGTRHVLNACAAAKVQRVVIASSTMLYGPRLDNPNFLTENHPLRGHPHAHNVQNRVEVESLVAEWARQHADVEVTVLRPCWIMGASHWDSVVRYFSRPVVPTLLGYDPLLQFVHEEDCLHVFTSAVLEGHPGVFNVVGSGVLPLSTLLAMAGKRALRLPSPLLYRLGAYATQAQTGDRPDGFYDYLRYLWVADGERGWNAFGEPAYSTREAWMAFISARRMLRYR